MGRGRRDRLPSSGSFRGIQWRAGCEDYPDGRQRVFFRRVQKSLTQEAVETTYTNLRDRLASVLDQVIDDQEIVFVRRRRSKDVALIAAAELAGLMETAHLLRSPKNAKRLLTAMRRAERGQGKPESLSNLRREMGLEPAR